MNLLPAYFPLAAFEMNLLDQYCLARSIEMADGWRPVVFSEELFDAVRQYYEENKERLKLKQGVRSLTGLLNYTIWEFMKEKSMT